MDGRDLRTVCVVVPLRVSLSAAEEPDFPAGGLRLPHAAVWRADALAQAGGAVRASGHAALDAVLPGGGWPVGALVELLQTQPGQGEWRLLAPALAATTGLVVLVAPPHLPFVPALAAQGLAPARLLRVGGGSGGEGRGRPPGAGVLPPAARVWACEQALRGAGVAAVLAWLPQVRPEQLRRLQMAAQTFQQLLFVMRPLAAQHDASPAVLRLALDTGTDSDALSVRLLKRRGPPLNTPLQLPARPERLQALLAASRQQAERRRQARGAAQAAAATPPSPPPVAPVRLLREAGGATAPASAGLAALLNNRVPAGANPGGGAGALDCLVAPAGR